MSKFILLFALTLALAKGEELEYLLCPRSNVTAIFLTCCQRYDLLRNSMIAFAQNNDYPVRQIIVMHDGPPSMELYLNLSQFSNITIVTTGQKIGQVLSIDKAYSMTKTAYAWYNQDDITLANKGVIKKNIEMLERDPILVQVWNDFDTHPNARLIGRKGYVDPANVFSTFSFNPTVNRMDLYRALKKGYVELTFNQTYGTSDGQWYINRHYRFLEFRATQRPDRDTIHKGWGRTTRNFNFSSTLNEPIQLKCDTQLNITKIKPVYSCQMFPQKQQIYEQIITSNVTPCSQKQNKTQQLDDKQNLIIAIYGILVGVFITLLICAIGIAVKKIFNRIGEKGEAVKVQQSQSDMNTQK